MSVTDNSFFFPFLKVGCQNKIELCKEAGSKIHYTFNLKKSLFQENLLKLHRGSYKQQYMLMFSFHARYVCITGCVVACRDSGALFTPIRTTRVSLISIGRLLSSQKGLLTFSLPHVFKDFF